MTELMRGLLKATPKTPVSDIQTKVLRKIRNKALKLIGLYLAIVLYLYLTKKWEYLSTSFVCFIVISCNVLLSELLYYRKLKKYEALYVIKAYVEHATTSYFNHSQTYNNDKKEALILYYDIFDHIILCRNITVYRTEAAYSDIHNGAVIDILMGKKNDKLHYISTSPDEF